VQFLNFPGGNVPYINEMQFVSESSAVRVPCFRLLDEYGQVVEHACLPEVRYDVSLFVAGGTFCKRLEKIR
jgi:2-oxoisovalerate dehydrogenase E1 component alpha subunit